MILTVEASNSNHASACIVEFKQVIICVVMVSTMQATPCQIVACIFETYEHGGRMLERKNGGKMSTNTPTYHR